MIELELSPAELERLVAALAAPRVTGASCRVAEGVTTKEAVLALVLKEVETGQEVLGKPLPRVDVELELSARRLDDGRISVAWSVVGIASLPSFVVRMLPIEAATRSALSAAVEKAGLVDAVEIGADSLVLDLARIALGPLGKGWLACDALRVPDGERALGAKLRLAPPSGAAGSDPYSVRP